MPLANIGSPTAGEVLAGPVVELERPGGRRQRPLEPVDSAGPIADYMLGHC